MDNKTTDKLFSSCRLCPHECGADRTAGQTGRCKAGNKLKAARAALHKWEEPCICTKNGAGAVFFSYCALGCVYCQNREISHGGFGVELSTDRLAEIFLRLQDEGACCIDLVTPMHFAPLVVTALEKVKGKSLDIPVAVNCSGYEKRETVRMFDGLCDIWLPDYKYADERRAVDYSNAPRYPDIAIAAIDEMLRMAGEPRFDGEELKSGVIVRHLLLPGALTSSMRAVERLYSRYGDSIILSLMDQYTPMGEEADYPLLSRRVPGAHYDALVDFAADLGVTRCYVQDGAAADKSFIPLFNGEGI